MLRQYFDNASVSVAELLQLRTRPEWNIMEPLRDQLISLKYFDTINNICKYKQNQIASITKHLNQLESKLYFDEQLIKVEPNDNMDTSSDNNNNNSSQISVVDLLSQESQSNIKIEPSGMSSLIQQTQYSNVSQFTNNDNDDDSEVMNDMIPKPTHGLMNIWNPNNIASGQQNNIIVSETQSSNISHIASPIKFNNFQNEPYIRSSLSIPTQLAQQMNTADDSPTGPQHTPPAFGAPTTPPVFQLSQEIGRNNAFDIDQQLYTIHDDEQQLNFELEFRDESPIPHRNYELEDRMEQEDIETYEEHNL
eukprot:282056_1